MKWFSLLFFVSIIQIQGNTQVLSFVAGDTIITYFDVDDYTPAHTKISNLVDSSVIFHWKIVTYDHPIEWEFSLCDYPMCYTGGEMEGIMDPVSALSNEAFLTVNVEATYADTGFYQIMVWNENHLAQADTLTVIMIAGISFSETSFFIPNKTPSVRFVYENQSLCFSNPQNKPIHFEISDLMGRRAFELIVEPQSDFLLNTNFLNETMYIVHTQNFPENFEFYNLRLP